MSNLIDQASLVMIPSGYKEDKIYSQVPTDGSGDIQFTRASDGTRVNSQGLVERVPWNLASDSNSFPFLSGITKTTGQNDPFGGANGNLLTATGTGEHYTEPTSLTAIVGNTYTFSVYGKFVQGVNLALRTVFANGNSDISTIWNLSTGAIVLNATDHTNPTITSVGNGWYRCSITYTPASVPAFPLLFRLQMAVGTNLSFTATSGDGFLAYGAQINEGTLKPYFPTTDRLNVPRLDYSNGCPSLLLEPQRTNLLTYSEQIDNAAWTKGNTTVTANQTTSPDGTQNADSLSEQAVNGIHYAGQGIAFASASTYTFSCFLKQGTQQYGGFRAVVNGFVNRYFVLLDLSNGSVVDTETLGIGVTWSHNVQSFANGWYRLTITAPHTSGNVDLSISPSDSASPSYSLGLPSYNGNTSKNIYAWGAQLEAGSYPTSYIPTTSASVTRVADAAYKTGISSLIGQSEGTIFVEFDQSLIGQSATRRIFALSDGTTNNRITAYINSGNKIDFYVRNSGGDLFLGTASTAGNTKGVHKIAAVYKDQDYAVYFDGSSIISGTGTAGTIPACSRFDLANQLGANDLYEPINQAVLFKTRLTNAELAALTTL